MNDLNITFCRSLLAATMTDVRKHTTAEQRKAAWVIRTDRSRWEFHGPERFYWYGRADNAYDARSSGWAAWLRQQGVNGYATEEVP